MTTLYIAGPMTGLEDYNYPAFNAAAAQLRDVGYEVLNPTLDRETPSEDPPSMTWVDYLRASIVMVAKADGIALLPGWQDSKGARLEVHIADQLGYTLAPVNQWVEDAA